MSVHTYVGARYIPRFMGSYDVTQQYEALDVVDNGSGTSYIARKIVPPGTPLTDTEYWFLYGASTGAIIQLQNDMIQAQYDIGNLQTDLGALEKKTERNLLVIGNSYVDRGCTADLEALFDHAYEYTEDGYGFVDYTGHSDNFSDVLTTAAADPSLDNNSITDILFVSAMGDTRAYVELGRASYITALQTSLTAIKATIASDFPNAKFVSISYAEARDVATFSNNSYAALYRVHHVFNKYVGEYGFRYIGWSGFNNLFKSDRLASDHFHPSTLGAAFISAWILSSYFGHAEYEPLTFSGGVACSYTASSNLALAFDIMPDRANINLKYMSATSGAAITLVNNDPLFSPTDTNLTIPLIKPSFHGPQGLVYIGTGSSATPGGAMRLVLDEDSAGRAYFKVSAHSSGTAPANSNYLGGFNIVSYAID